MQTSQVPIDVTKTVSKTYTIRENKFMKFIILSMFLASYAFAHGENKPGPHGGHIRMPGAFHTELVLQSHMAKVYLLDIGFKNPTTKNSTLSLKVDSGKSLKEVSCSPKNEFFECHIPDVKAVKEIQIKASRSGVSGKEITYNLPLMVFKNNVSSSTDDHTHHGH